MKRIIVAFYLVIATVLHAAKASEVRDRTYSAPTLVERTVVGVTFKECLANLTPASASNTSYMCRIPFSAPTDGSTFVFDATPPMNRAAFMGYSGNLRTPTGSIYNLVTKIAPMGKEIIVSVESYTRDTSTGGTVKVIRTDAVNEITRLWAANNLQERAWTFLVWVAPR